MQNEYNLLYNIKILFEFDYIDVIRVQFVYFAVGHRSQYVRKTLVKVFFRSAAVRGMQPAQRLCLAVCRHSILPRTCSRLEDARSELLKIDHYFNCTRPLRFLGC